MQTQGLQQRPGQNSMDLMRPTVLHQVSWGIRSSHISRSLLVFVLLVIFFPFKTICLYFLITLPLICGKLFYIFGSKYLEAYDIRKQI